MVVSCSAVNIVAQSEDWTDKNEKEIRMSIVINTNVAALTTRNALTRATWNLNKSMERLSTGNRINQASDDPAGYYYASKLGSEIRASKIAYQNAQSGLNMIQIAEGDLDAINTQLERIKDLATQYANGTLTTEQQSAIKMEAQQRIDEINRIVSSSEFNGVKLLDGSNDGARLQIGVGSDSTTNSIAIQGVMLNAGTGQDGIKLFGTGTDQFENIDAAFASAETAADFIDVVQASADIVTQRISTAGAYESRLISVNEHLMVKNENLSSAYSTIMDTDISEETANFVKNQILQQTASTMLIQATQTNGVIALSLISSL